MSLKVKTQIVAAIIITAVGLGLAKPAPAQTTQSPYELTVEAFVDGPSSLHFTRTGFYWRNSRNAKPGRLGGKDEPTYINSRQWMPKWRKPRDDRGDDKSEPYAWNIPTVDLQVELVSVTDERGKTGIEKREPLEMKREGNEFVVQIPDPEPGARWYKLVIRAPDPLRTRPLPAR